MAFSPDNILAQLRKALAHGRLPHAMLITGPEGSGREQLARDIAAMVNSTDDVAAHPDIHVIEPESKSRRIRVEAFRDFCAPFFATSFRAGATKVGLVLEADRLHINAANAFLKTLEEPPANCLFILVTASPGLLPVTIVSRCSHFPLRQEELPALEGQAAEVAKATGEMLASPPPARPGAALRLARKLQSLLRDTRATIESEATSAYKEQAKRLGDAADEAWRKEEEARLKALVEARALAVRQRLVSIVSERAADVLRARHGVAGLRFPSLADESDRLARSLDDTSLLRVLDGAARLRLLLDRNVKEDLALEAGCLALARP